MKDDFIRKRSLLTICFRRLNTTKTVLWNWLHPKQWVFWPMLLFWANISICPGQSATVNKASRLTEWFTINGWTLSVNSNRKDWPIDWILTTVLVGEFYWFIVNLKNQGNRWKIINEKATYNFKGYFCIIVVILVL